MVIYKNQEGFPRIFPRVFQGCDIENREKAAVGTRRQLKLARMKVTMHGQEKEMTYSHRKDRVGQQGGSRVPLLGAMEHGLNSACCKEKQGRTPWWQVEP